MIRFLTTFWGLRGHFFSVINDVCCHGLLMVVMMARKSQQLSRATNQYSERCLCASVKTSAKVSRMTQITKLMFSREDSIICGTAPCVAGFRMNVSSWPTFLLRTLAEARFAPSDVFVEVSRPDRSEQG